MHRIRAANSPQCSKESTVPQGWLQLSSFTLFGAQDFVPLPTSPQRRTLFPQGWLQSSHAFEALTLTHSGPGWQSTALAAGRIT